MQLPDRYKTSKIKKPSCFEEGFCFIKLCRDIQTYAPPSSRKIFVHFVWFIIFNIADAKVGMKNRCAKFFINL